MAEKNCETCLHGDKDINDTPCNNCDPFYNLWESAPVPPVKDMEAEARVNEIDIWKDLIVEYKELERMEENDWEWNIKILMESFTISKKVTTTPN